ncbi:MAG TPA: hypothetical protein VHE35_15515 [Kofleriaceae bacterium]|nr:hypothetical protein [Kofleriaceae bacterium]
MSMRIAIYVYSKSTVTVAPDVTTDFMQMNNDYTAGFVATISSPVSYDLDPGVYGFIYKSSHGVSGPTSITIVTDVYDVERKTAWPTPPPPPPPPFMNRRDWDQHRHIFMTPLGSTFVLGANASQD